MAINLSPPPIDDVDSTFIFKEWLNKLYRYVGGAGTVPWDTVDKAGSNLNDLAIKNHSSLDGVQGSSEEFHVSEQGYYNSLNPVTTTAVNYSLVDTYRTVYVTATGKTITLPAASTVRIGSKWTIILATTGYVDITRAGSDTITLPTTDTTIRLTNKGASVTLCCLTASSWGIV